VAEILKKPQRSKELLTNVVGLLNCLVVVIEWSMCFVFFGSTVCWCWRTDSVGVWRSSRQVWSCVGFSRLVDLVCRVVVEIVCVCHSELLRFYRKNGGTASILWWQVDRRGRQRRYWVPQWSVFRRTCGVKSRR
jgi:hypothetical protein